MNRFARRGLTVVGIVIIVLVLVAIAARMAAQPGRGTVVEVILREEIPETPPAGPFASVFGPKRLTVRDHVEGILRARDDRRINGLMVTLDRPGLGFARSQEIRDALLEFQTSGKWVECFMETAGEFAPGNRDYYLATACGTIWLAPPGDVNLTGLRFEPPFLRGTFDKLGLYPDFDHIGKYKTAMNILTEKTMTGAHREMMESIADSLYGQIRRGIAEGRHIPEEKAAAIIDGGPYTGPQALQAKLVDRLGYRDEFLAGLKEKNGGRLPIQKMGRYLKSGRYYDRGVKVALIYGVGGVARGESDYDPMSGEPSMGSDTVAAAIKKAREDRSIRAIVFRVNSPGGSYVASDIIWREVTLTRGVKPIVVSMSDLAGSGGYFVAMNADRIVAQPGTLTASIGVLAGKFVTPGFWDKIGLSFDAVQRGRHAAFYSTHQKYTVEERAIFTGWLQRIYRDFAEKAAKGRGKTFEQIDAIGQGRVWTGEDALRLGLVDEMGGLTTAIRRALDLAKIDPASRVNLVVLPRPKPFFMEILGRGEETRAALAALQARLARFVREGPESPGERVLEMPVVPDFR